MAALEIGGAHFRVGQQLARRCRTARCGRSASHSRDGPAAAHDRRSVRPAAPSFSAPLISRIASKICLTISGASPSEGSSSSSSRGRLISARPIASICCSPPDSVPPRCRRRSSRIGNSAKTRRQSSSKCAGSAVAAPIRRFSSTVMRGKMRRPSGACAMPSRMISKVGRRVMSRPSNTIRPRAATRVAADRHQQRRFAGAVGADHRDDLAGADLRDRRLSAPRHCRKRHERRRRSARETQRMESLPCPSPPQSGVEAVRAAAQIAAIRTVVSARC